MSPFQSLRPFARRAQALRPTESRCELCGALVAEKHAHVVELQQHAMRCACTACAVLFRDAGAGGGRYRTVPERIVELGPLALDASDWAQLEIPVQLAFVIRRDQGFVAMYPSPAGPVEAPLSAAASTALITRVPRASRLEPEIEALLFHRPRDGSSVALLVPIDACYELVGLVRQSWRGFDGGDAREQIDRFVTRLRSLAKRDRT